MNIKHVTLATALLLSTSIGLAAPAHAAAMGEAAALANIRSGPSTSKTSLGLLAPGEDVIIHSTRGGWSEVTRLNGTTGYVYAPLLDTTPSVVQTAKTRKWTRVHANTTTRSAVLTAVPAQTSLVLTGKRMGKYTQVIANRKVGWVSTSNLRPPAPKKHSSPTPSKPTPKPLPVDRTSLVSKGTVTVTASELYVRSTSHPQSKVRASVYRGDTLKTTGVVSGDRLQVIHNGQEGWVFRAYTNHGGQQGGPASTGWVPRNSAALDVRGMEKVNPNVRAIVDETIRQYPQIKSIYGYRPGTRGEHPQGKAVDLMISKYGTTAGNAVGDEAARYFQAHAREYGIYYIIWEQRIWIAGTPFNQWTKMENRGSDTQNHYDHVHISVY